MMSRAVGLVLASVVLVLMAAASTHPLPATASPAAGRLAGTESVVSHHSLVFNGLQRADTVAPIELRNSSFTIAFWVKRDDIHRSDLVVGQGSATPGHGLFLGFRPNAKFTCGFGAGDDLDAQILPDSAWHHWACTYDLATKVRAIYQDGECISAPDPAKPVQCGRSVATLYEGDGIMTIGATSIGNSTAGWVDDVGVWKKALSQTDVMEVARGNRVAGGLEAYWDFEEGDGLKAEDSSGKHYDVTLPGPIWSSSVRHPPGVIYVNEHASGANNGTSWRDAFTELQAALGASYPGAEIWVAKGIYEPVPEGPLPARCTDVKAIDSWLNEGEYLIRSNGSPFSVYCDDMMTDTPREFVTLKAGNFSLYEDFAPHPSAPTDFYKLRIDPSDLRVDIMDTTFSHNESRWTGVSIPYGTAMSCHGGMSGVAGRFQIDLTLTPFVIPPDPVQKFSLGGIVRDPRDWSVTRDGQQKVYGAVYGNCAMIVPGPVPVDPRALTAPQWDRLKLGMLAEEPRRDTFALKPLVAVYGGFAGGESSRDQRDWMQNLTILSGDIDSNDADPDRDGVIAVGGIAGMNSYHVVSAAGAGSAVLDGFTVTAGNADEPVLSDTCSENSCGGGMYINGDSPTVRNLRFRGNHASYAGGGLYVYKGSPQLQAVTFVTNTAGVYGGGMFSASSQPALQESVFEDNMANSGGGISNDDSGGSLRGVTFRRNRGESGAGMTNRNKSSPTLMAVRFVGNVAHSKGGGMLNEADSRPSVYSAIFNGNQAENEHKDGGDGGAIYNEGSRPTLTNVTLHHNHAFNGGGIANTNASKITLGNTIMWGNTATGAKPEVYNLDSSSEVVARSCMVQVQQVDTACTVQPDKSSPFVDADGLDNRLGTEDDDLRLAVSNAIDAGDNSALPTDARVDLGGASRCYADLDLDGSLDHPGSPCEHNKVDLGAYEAQCSPWHMRIAGSYLTTGRKYREGFHAEIGEPSKVTVGMTLDGYAHELSARNLITATLGYSIALGCATTASETNAAMLGIQNVTWEQATGGMLLGNEKMVRALDLANGTGIGPEIKYLEEAKQLYATATDRYLTLLASGRFPEFLALQPQRIDPISLNPNPYADVKRLAEAAGSKSRAYLELADRQFRNDDLHAAAQTLREGREIGSLELALLPHLWDDIVSENAYKLLLRNQKEMDRLYTYLAGGKNFLGYGGDFVPIHHAAVNNNYTLWFDEFGRFLVKAKDAVNDAKTAQKEVDDDEEKMQERYFSMEKEFGNRILELCGSAAVEDKDGNFPCNGGALQEQQLVIDEAALRVERTIEDVRAADGRISNRLDAIAAIEETGNLTVKLISPDGDAYYDMVEKKPEVEWYQKAFGLYQEWQGAASSGAEKGANFGPQGAVIGGLVGLKDKGVDTFADAVGLKAEEGPPFEERIAKFQAWAQGQIVLNNKNIEVAKYQADLKDVILEYGGLEIDNLIQLNSLQQELARRAQIVTEVEYLIAERSKARAFTALLYRDPAQRVLRDYNVELAQTKFDRALDLGFRAGRALEYEANKTAGEFSPRAPDPDSVGSKRSVSELQEYLDEMEYAHTIWNEGATTSYVTEIPLSQLLGFKDMELPDVGLVSGRDQFKAFLRDPENRVDANGDGRPEEIAFSFATSIHKGNPFFSYSVFNDRIESVAVRVLGADLGVAAVSVNLLWGKPGCDQEASNCGTAFIRTSKAFANGDADDIRVYRLKSVPLVLNAPTTSAPLSENDFNRGLAMRSVASPSWTLAIRELDRGVNERLNVDNINDIVLVIKHGAIALGRAAAASGAPDTAGGRDSNVAKAADGLSVHSSSAAGAPVRPQRPGQVVDTIGKRFVGTVAVESPLYMPTINLGVVLSGFDANGDVSGYIDSGYGLSYPVVDSVTGQGPGLTGSRIGNSFDLTSEPFFTELAGNIPITRSVRLDQGVVTSGRGITLTGLYVERIEGLTPEPLTVTGQVALYRSPDELPPEAAFAAIPLVGTAPLTVRFSDRSEHSPTNRTWRFGDGAVAYKEQYPIHTYVDAGTYSVTLDVSNAAGEDTMTRTDYIVVSEPASPVAHFTASPTSGMAPLTVLFTDQSAGKPTSWSWSFGDGGTSAERNPTHVYAAVGTYDVSLTSSGALGSNKRTEEGYITVKPLEADFTADPTSGPAPLTVTFTDRSLGNPTGWAWQFGDGASSTAKNPSHVYANPGDYTVTLIVTQDSSTDTERRENYITVSAPPPPVAAFTASPVSGPAPLEVRFTDRSTGSPKTWSWRFGDGATSTEQNPVHTFSNAGRFTVSLTVRNDWASNTRTMLDYITVSRQTGVRLYLPYVVKDHSLEVSSVSWRWDPGEPLRPWRVMRGASEYWCL
jgi:PKD repeat protein